ncbi:MAG TPA: hypothetical protein VEI24_03275 [Nitrospiria bacterium]|nr:hypothetical protein [Nitrospiria bacterium]
MSYTLTITPKPGYLHAVVTGRNSLENVKGYLADIQRACAARNCYRILIEERLEGPRLGIMDVFRIASEGSRIAHEPFKAIAYVDVFAKGDLMKFAETVAVNRAMPVRVFSSVIEAERWLRGDDQNVARQ